MRLNDYEKHFDQMKTKLNVMYLIMESIDRMSRLLHQEKVAAISLLFE